jgi:hypothetical protein
VAQVLIPERTVDAWLSIYLSDRFPLVSVWAPAHGWDFEVNAGLDDGKIALFECKTAVETRPGRPGLIYVGLQQLQRYIRSPGSSFLYYVLPAPPAVFQARNEAAVPPSPPAQGRLLWTCQQWFYVISAARLWTHFVHGVVRAGSTSLLIRTDELSGLEGARPLWAYAQQFERCEAGYRVFPPRPNGYSPLPPPQGAPPREESDALEDWEGIRDIEWTEAQVRRDDEPAATSVVRGDGLVFIHVPAASLLVPSSSDA